MIWLRKLLGYDDKFFDLLEASAVEARSSVQLLVDLLRDSTQCPTLEAFVVTRRKDKRITEKITEELCRTFVTPLEREDIEELSFALYKIPKTAEKFSGKFMLCRKTLLGSDFSRQVALLEKAVQTVVEMVQKLRQRKHLESMKDQIGQLHYLEGAADKLILELVRELYSGKYEPLQVIITMDLYETLEKIIDRCRDAGNVVFQIVLKYS
ncbi:MAG: DUF47 family protein [Kiritimatiellaeota bacterium]|nr:DUF47 family protein [Kiritimatiellota bacterium]